jgi:radical SAM superfamily enzyme YgiQ (UPF0313 family)
MTKFLFVANDSIVEPLGILFLISSLSEIDVTSSIFLLNDQNEKELIPKIINEKWDYVGFSVYTGFHTRIFPIADKLKGFTQVVIGGPHATFFDSESYLHSDFVIKGEGLESIKQLFSKYEKSILFEPQLVNSESIPIPNHKLLYKVSDKHAVNPIKNVITSLGYPYNCSYCYNNSYRILYPNQKIIRQRSLDSIIQECIELLDFPLKLIYFQDDCFGFDLEWLKNFSKRFPVEVNRPFHCQLRPEMATIERLELLKSSGCQGITLAIETYDETIRRKLLNRSYDNISIQKSCSLIKSMGFKLRTEQMLGIPLSSISDELNLLKMNCDINPDIAWVSMYTPYLGTTLGDYCKNIGIYKGTNDDLEDSFFTNTPLSFDSTRSAKTNKLLPIFSTCAKIPKGWELAQQWIEMKETDKWAWFFLMKEHLFRNCLYKVD